MVDLEELHEFATGLPDGADTLVRDAIAELTHLRAKAAAGAKLRVRMGRITLFANDAKWLAEYDETVGEGDTK